MPDRLSRPPIVLKAAQPDGTSNGLGRAATHFLGPDKTDTRFLVLEVGVAELVTKIHTGNVVAVLEIVKVAMPADQHTLAAMLGEALAADFEGTMPAFPVTDRGRYEAALDVWAEKKDLSSADVRAEWEKLFGPEVPGPAGAATEHLIEFVLEVAGPLDDEPVSGATAGAVHDAQAHELETGHRHPDFTEPAEEPQP